MILMELQELELLLEIVKALFVMFFGLCFGSFLNVVIYRLPLGMNLAKPASHCPKCNYKLKWYDNIPVISYLILGGKCRNCHDKISIRYTIVELLTTVLFILVYAKYGVSLLTLIGFISVLIFVSVIFIDLEHYIIPDSLNIILGITGIIALFFTKMEYGRFSIGITDKLIGFLIGVLLLIIIILVEKIFKKEVMGGGDIKLIMATGLILGWQLTLLGIFFGSVIALLVEIPLSLNKEKRKDHVLPYGPYLSAGFMIAFLYGLVIIESYLQMCGM